jgi:hypothetical protein
MTDPDARSVAASSKGSGMVGYNVQVAVDSKYHLIMAHEVTNSGSDRAQLSSMAKLRATRWVRPGRGQSPIVAPTLGLRQGVRRCGDCGHAVKPTTSGAKYHGRFDEADFIYIARDDEYQCSGGERAIYRYTSKEHGMQLHRYWRSACAQCKIKRLCRDKAGGRRKSKYD